MSNKFIFHIVCTLSFFTVSFGYAQKHFIKDYPEGSYYSYEDFVNKKVRPSVRLERHTSFGDHIIPNDSIVENQVFFYRVKDTSKVTDVFAISFKGNLYFKQREMSKHAKKGDRDETGSNPNLYHRVIKDGNFFYMEGMFGNVWAKGLAYNGGAVGGAMAANINKFKGVIYDFSKNEFDFFRKCKDFNTFLSTNAYPEINCEDKEYSTSKVREIIDKLISQ